MSAAFPAPADDGGANHLVRGLAMPDIALPATTGEQVTLSARSGWTALFVYTWTGRPGVANPPDWDPSPERTARRRKPRGFAICIRRFASTGWKFLALSVQTTDWQRELAERLALPFALVSDAQLTLQCALRLPTFETGGVTYLKRLTLGVERRPHRACVLPRASARGARA